MHIGIFTLRDMNMVGGGWLRLVGPAQYLQEMGCKVTMFAPNCPDALKGKTDFVPIRGQLGNPEPFRRLLLLQASYSPLLALSRCLPFYRGLAQTLNEHNLDVIHCHGHSGGLLLLRILRKLHAPVAFDLHGMYRLQLPEGGRLRERLARYVILRAERRLFQNMNALVVAGEHDRKLLLKEYEIPPHRLHIVPIGADVEFLCQPISEVDKSALREELGLRAGERVILFAGGLKPGSGVIDLLRAFRLSRSNISGIRLVIIGDVSDYTLKVEMLIREHGLLECVVLLGRQSRERFRIFQHISDVIVVPDVDSAFNRLYPPQKLYDALASAKPAVVTRVASHLRLVQDGKTGYLVEPGNPADMARGIEHALADSNRFAVGQRAQCTMKQEHSWQRTAEITIQTYKHIAQQDEALRQ